MREFEIMRYSVRLVPAPEGGYVVSFPDIPEALTQGRPASNPLILHWKRWSPPLNSISKITSPSRYLRR